MDIQNLMILNEDFFNDKEIPEQEPVVYEHEYGVCMQLSCDVSDYNKITGCPDKETWKFTENVAERIHNKLLNIDFIEDVSVGIQTYEEYENCLCIKMDIAHIVTASRHDIQDFLNFIRVLASEIETKNGCLCIMNENGFNDVQNIQPLIDYFNSVSEYMNGDVKSKNITHRNKPDDWAAVCVCELAKRVFGFDDVVNNVVIANLPYYVYKQHQEVMNDIEVHMFPGGWFVTQLDICGLNAKEMKKLLYEDPDENVDIRFCKTESLISSYQREYYTIYDVRCSTNLFREILDVVHPMTIFRDYTRVRFDKKSENISVTFLFGYGVHPRNTYDNKAYYMTVTGNTDDVVSLLYKILYVKNELFYQEKINLRAE